MCFLAESLQILQGDSVQSHLPNGSIVTPFHGFHHSLHTLAFIVYCEATYSILSLLILSLSSLHKTQQTRSTLAKIWPWLIHNCLKAFFGIFLTMTLISCLFLSQLVPNMSILPVYYLSNTLRRFWGANSHNTHVPARASRTRPCNRSIQASAYKNATKPLTKSLQRCHVVK